MKKYEKKFRKLLPKTLVSTPVISIIGLMATGCNDKKSDDSLNIFLDEKSAENLYINKTKATKNKALSLEVTPYQGYEVLASEFVVKVGANLLWECRNMISTINIQDLQADIFTYSDYSLAVSSEEYRMYTTGITIKGTYAEDFKARFPDDAETLIFWFDCYRKLLIG